MISYQTAEKFMKFFQHYKWIRWNQNENLYVRPTCKNFKLRKINNLTTMTDWQSYYIFLFIKTKVLRVNKQWITNANSVPENYLPLDWYVWHKKSYMNHYKCENQKNSNNRSVDSTNGVAESQCIVISTVILQEFIVRLSIN